MIFSAAFRKKHLEGPGGILELLPIAIPMFVSSMFDMLMTFIDRLFLAHVGIVHQAAAMTGGLSNWMCVTLFAGLVGYSSALVAQYYGAGQRENCVRTAWQAVRLAVWCYPLVLAADYLISISPVFNGHEDAERVLELRYFWYMGFGSIITLARFACSSFFAGLGRTRIVLVANSVALVVNVIANWILIFGHLGSPALGLDGAAIGTLLSGVATCVVLYAVFMRTIRGKEFAGAGLARLHTGILWKLVRYGLPQGLENALEMTGFLVLVSSFHCYGEDMATATTIAFNWDGMSFHPMVGISAAVVTLVGQAMGKGRPDIACRVAVSGFKVSLLYTFMMMTIYVTCSRFLVGIFTPQEAGLDYTKVREYAVPMLRLAGVYLMTDALQLVSSGVLRGAGDTMVGMFITILRDWGNALLVIACIHWFSFGPFQTWICFVAASLVLSIPMIARYKQGRWKTLRIIAE